MKQIASSHGQFETAACDVQETQSTMISSFVDSKHQQEFEHVLAYHVVPHLRLRDAQALSRACSSLHRVVQTSLPAATWAILARCNFLPGHPLPAADSWHMQAEMAQLVQFHASVRSGKCVRTANACMLKGSAARDLYTDSPAYLSHSGELFVCLRAKEIRLYSLSLSRADGGRDGDHDRPMASLIFSRPSMEGSNTAEHVECKCVWSPDDSWVAIWYTVRDYDDPRNEFNANGFFDVVYVLDVTAREVAEVMHTAEVETLNGVSIAPNGKLLSLYWHNYPLECTQIDIFSRADQQLISRVEDKGSRGNHLAWSPSSKYFAMPHNADVNVYSTAGSLKAVLGSGIPASPQSLSWEQVVWSPDESYLAFWRPGNPSALCIFETEQWTLVRSIAVQELETCDKGAGLLWALCGLMPIVQNPDDWRLRTLLLPYGRPGNGKLPCREVARIQNGVCLPAISGDGAFVAVLDDGRHQCHVLDALSGAPVFSGTVLGAVANQQQPALAWAGRRLLVKRRAATPNSEVLTVFDF